MIPSKFNEMIIQNNMQQDKNNTEEKEDNFENQRSQLVNNEICDTYVDTLLLE